MGFVLCIGSDRLKIGGINCSCPTPLHLFKIGSRSDGTHKQQTFQRLDISSCRDHIHRYGNTGIVRISKCRNQIFRFFPGSPIGDFLGKIISLVEFFPQNMKNILCVWIVFGKDQGLGDFCPAGEYLRKEFVSKFLHDSSNLIDWNNRTIQLITAILKVFIQLLPPFFSGQFVPFVNIEAWFNCTAVLGNLGFNRIDFISHIDFIHHSPFMAIFRHDILVEEAERVFWRSSR